MDINELGTGRVWVEECDMSLNAAASPVANNSLLAVQFDTVQHDPGGGSAGTGSGANFHCNRTGYYLVCWNSGVSFTTQNNYYTGVQINSNSGNARIFGGIGNYATAGADGVRQINGAKILFCFNGDNIQVLQYQGSGGSLNVVTGVSETWMEVTFLREA